MSLDSRSRAIYDALIHDILTNPELESARDFYGTPGDHRFALVQMEDYGVPWHPSYKPSVNGFELSRAIGHTLDEQQKPRLLGIRLDKFRLDQKPDVLLDGQIQVTLLNAGGDGGESIHIGGCMVYYDVKQDGTEWKVEFRGWRDP